METALSSSADTPLWQKSSRPWTFHVRNGHGASLGSFCLETVVVDVVTCKCTFPTSNIHILSYCSLSSMLRVYGDAIVLVDTCFFVKAAATFHKCK